MLEVNSIASQVKYNCDISDARYWGFYSPCALLLRLRDLFKIERGLKPWARVDHQEIGEWISKKEEQWRELETFDFQEIEINGRKYKPFDIKGINSLLLREGLLYGAGYGNFLKPAFLLARLFRPGGFAEANRKTRIGKYNIYFSDRELACDLSDAPAMLQGNTIIARRETTRHLLWGRFEEMSSKRHAGALRNAFSEYGIFRETQRLSEGRLERLFTKIADDELSTYVHHEIGEASQRRLLGRWWKELLLKLPYSRAQLFIRALKDVLSDTCPRGMLSHIIRYKKAGSLSFYVAMLGGFRRRIFPDIVPIYDEFIKAHNWSLIDKARMEGYRRARRYVKTLKAMMDKGEVSQEKIEKELMSKIF